MKIAALLPHVEVFGGVRRYLEIGNELTKRGHAYCLFHPEGNLPGWLPFLGATRPLAAIEEDAFDIGLCSEYSILSEFDRLRARRKFFYFILEGHKKEKDVVRSNYLFLGNSEGICRRLEGKYKIRCLKAAGGINPDIFHPLEKKPARDTFNILCYGRIFKRRKGIRRAIRAVESLAKEFPRLRLILFDAPVGRERRDPRPLVHTRLPHDFYLDLPQDRLAWLFAQADIFISAELRAGWSNTSAEAMACGVPVVCTPSGTRDFAFHNETALVVPLAWPFLLRRALRRLLLDEGLRQRLARAGHEKIREFTWGALADRLVEIFRSSQN